MVARSRRTTLTLAASLVGALLFLGFAILLAGSTTTSRATSNARLLHWYNATNGSIAAVRASTSQAVLFAFVAEAGIGDEDASARAHQEAVVGLDRAGEWVDAAAGAGVAEPDLLESLEEFARIGGMVLASLDRGDIAAADEIFSNRLEPAWSALEVEMVAETQRLAEEIGQSEGFSALLAALSRVALLLLLPLAAIAVYRWRARREQEETRVRLEAELAAEQEIGKAKVDFIAGVSHELRTPLTSVVGFSHLLLGNPDDPELVRELAAGVSGEAGELSRMVDDLLVASRPGDTEVPVCLEDGPISAQVEAVVAPHRRLGREIHTRLEPGTVHADPTRVRQIVRNLVSNALKHGGPTVWVTGAPRGDRYLLVVADDGEGIGPEISSDLFRPFVHNGGQALVSGSVGLGLSVARQLARRMDGDLDYQRTDGWTQFVLRLPVSPAAEATPQHGMLQEAT